MSRRRQAIPISWEDAFILAFLICAALGGIALIVVAFVKSPATSSMFVGFGVAVAVIAGALRRWA